MCRLLQSLLVLKGLIMLCILVDFPIYVYIDTKSKGLPILYFKGSQVDASKLWCISVPEDCFNLANSADAAFHLTFHCLPKYPFGRGAVYKGLKWATPRKLLSLGLLKYI